jgi:hypothetical protein
MLNDSSSSKDSPPATCASAANVCRAVDIFGTNPVSLNHIRIATSIKILIVFNMNVCTRIFLIA